MHALKLFITLAKTHKRTFIQEPQHCYATIKSWLKNRLLSHCSKRIYVIEQSVAL
jgi:hypothetical protein